MTRRFFIDLDGVLADLRTAYFQKYGVSLSDDRNAQDPPNFTENLSAPRFFRDMPLMPDARQLWDGVMSLSGWRTPSVLTAVPRGHGAPNAADQKRAWVAEHFGRSVNVVCCFSNEKHLHGVSGDVLIDDWSRHQRKWVKMGGVFVLHTSAASSLDALQEML